MSDVPMSDRLAVCSWSLHPGDPQDLIDQLRELGMDKVQLALDPLWADAKWAEAGEALADAGVDIVSGMFGCQGEDYSTLDSIRRTGGVVPDGTWDANWSNIQKLVPLTTSLGLDLVTFHAGFLPEDPKGPAYQKLLTRLGLIADTFGEEGIAVGFETGQEDAQTLKSFLDRLNRQNVGVNFDPANMILYAKGDPVGSVKVLMPYVRQIHVKDALPTKVPGTWGAEVPVGTGAVDWPAFLRALIDGGSDGYLCIEREAGDERIPDIRSARKFILETLEELG